MQMKAKIGSPRPTDEFAAGIFRREMARWTSFLNTLP
jgi:hypothetical protein